MLGQSFLIPDLLITTVGVGAAVITTGSFLPQIIKAYKSNSMGDVAVGLLFMLIAGTVLWMVYGVFKGDWERRALKIFRN